MLSVRGWFLVGGVVLASLLVGSVIWLAQENGKLKAELDECGQALGRASQALSTAANNLRDYQDGNVFNREQAAALCSADVRAAYDAGRLYGQSSIADRQRPNAFVPGQRPAGGQE